MLNWTLKIVHLRKSLYCIYEVMKELQNRFSRVKIGAHFTFLGLGAIMKSAAMLILP